MTELLLESPWAVAGVLLVVAAVVRVAGQRSGQRGVVRLAPVLVGLAALVVAGAYLIETDRERVASATRDLVAATGPLDRAAAAARLTPGFTVEGPDGRAWHEGRDVVLDLLDGRVPDADHRVLTLDVPAVRGDTAEALLELRTRVEVAGGLPLRSAWRLTWVRDGDGRWRLATARWLRFNEQVPDASLIGR